MGSMRSAALSLCIMLAAGCASSGQATDAPDTANAVEAAGTASDQATLDMIVINRSTSPVTAYAQWRNGPRVPLGEVRASATRRFTTPNRGSEVWLSVDVLSAPSVGTQTGPVSISGRGGARPRENPTSFVTVQPFDTIEWEIRQTFPTVDVGYRRLPPPQ